MIPDPRTTITERRDTPHFVWKVLDIFDIECTLSIKSRRYRDSLRKVTYHPNTDKGGSRGVIDDRTLFLEKESGVFLFWGNVGDLDI